MKWRILILGLLVHFSTTGSAQPFWRAMGRGTVGPTEVQTLFGDTTTNRLLAGGTFETILNDNDAVLANGIAAWNGERWDSLGNRIAPSIGQTYWFLRFQGNLYACGGWGFLSSGGDVNWGLAKYEMGDEAWVELACANGNLTGPYQLVPKEPQGSSIYATGLGGTLCGFPQACIYRYDGTAFHEWEPWALIPPDNDNYVGYVFDFQGMTYMTGGFENPNETALAYFMRYNGSAWEDVPGWNNAPGIKDILIRNNTLYVAGSFRQSLGAPGNRIASFDGTTWNDMNGGLTLSTAPNNGSAMTLEWHHDKLYVGGFFDEAAGEQLGGGLAVWDGLQWFAPPGQFSSAPSLPNGAIVLDITTWRDSLYICGGFNMIDGDTIRQVAQFIGSDNDLLPVGLRQHIAPGQSTIFPNPASETITFVNAPDRTREFQIRDGLGRCVLSGTWTRSPLQVAELRAGPYVLLLNDAGGAVITSVRFIKR